MGKQKLIRYAAVKNFSNVIMAKTEKNRLVDLDAIWDPEKRVNGHEITLELGCGKAEYTISLARKHPDRFFIGVDIKSHRLWDGAGVALEENLTNVLFIRTPIDHLASFFPENSISEIWITFPDPYPTKKHVKKRLTSPRFLEIYKTMLKKGGCVHLKTDDETMHLFSKETAKEHAAEILLSTEDLYGSQVKDDEVLGIQTPFEKKFLARGKAIKYLKFQF